MKNIYAGKKFKISDIGLLFVINLWPDNVSHSLPPTFLDRDLLFILGWLL